jgi:hypothetical protein
MLRVRYHDAGTGQGQFSKRPNGKRNGVMMQYQHRNITGRYVRFSLLRPADSNSADINT